MTFGDAPWRLKSLCELCWLSLLNVRPLQMKEGEIRFGNASAGENVNVGMN